MKTVRVFPDYESTGLWEGAKPGGSSMSLSDFEGSLSPIILMALKYWHHTWELSELGMSKRYFDEWQEEGRNLVEDMNMHPNNTEYYFIYVESIYD